MKGECLHVVVEERLGSLCSDEPVICGAFAERASVWGREGLLERM